MRSKSVKSYNPSLADRLASKSVVQTITKGHNRHLEVESDEGIGTRFIIRLPLVRITDKND